MSRKKIEGTCNLCRKYGELSLEHVPPQKAFNTFTVVKYKLADCPSKQKAYGKKMQGGVNAYTLCGTCNNRTGGWYGREYVNWAIVGSKILADSVNRDTVTVSLYRVYPLRFLKQAITCFFSVISSPEAAFAANNPQLVQFVSDKTEQHLPTDFRFFLRLHRSPILRRYPLAAQLPVKYTKDAAGTTLFLPPDEEPSHFSEMTHFPFTLIMTFDTSFPKATEITHFKSYGYDEQTDLDIELVIDEGTRPWPGI